ncbi:MAG: glycosyltransferase, partial [Promethearchaeota archaeon]
AGINETGEINPNNVIRCGVLDRKEMSFLYTIADLVLVPTIEVEAFGRVVLESIYHGKHAIVSENVGALHDENYDFIARLPLKKDVWINKIKEMAPERLTIPENIKNKIVDHFTPEHCTKMILKTIRALARKQPNHHSES